jgi:hypothetical protein
MKDTFGYTFEERYVTNKGIIYTHFLGNSNELKDSDINRTEAIIKSFVGKSVVIYGKQQKVIEGRVSGRCNLVDRRYYIELLTDEEFSGDVKVTSKKPTPDEIATHQVESTVKYNTDADKYLRDLYKSVGATTWEEKFNTLELSLGVPSGSSNFSHNISWKQKCRALEYELLYTLGLLRLTFA